MPIDLNTAANERTRGASWDIDVKTNLGDVRISINQLLFYTRLNHPLVLVNTAGGKLELQNSAGHISSKGMETNLRVVLNRLKLFVGYTCTNANTYFGAQKEWLLLTARHRLNNLMLYEIEQKFKVDVEVYYFSKKKLSGVSEGRSYWLAGLIAEKTWKEFSLFINFENLTNTRQSKFERIFTGTIDQPVFKDIYASVKGFVANGGIRIRL